MMQSMITAERYHDFSCGHRVAGHENKCAMLHGHNYRVTFTLRADLDRVGRVLDFSVIKTALCQYLEDEWDHKFLAWERDPVIISLLACTLQPVVKASVVLVPFNPTAENMAQYLLEDIGPKRLAAYPGVELISVRVEETRKCSATAWCS